MLVSLLLGALGGVVGGRFLDDRLTPGSQATSDLPTGSGDDGPAGDLSVAAIAERVLPSTVYLQVRSGSTAVSGSGFVVREDGYLVTNEHVVQPAIDGGEIVVVFADGTEARAELIGSTSDYDLAVLRVDRDGLQPLVLGNSDSLVVGQPAIAVGAPLGLDGTVTAGIISALDRPVTIADSPDTAPTYINAIQTDAAINRGNSGGPLLDADGEVIGVNTAVARDSSAPGGNEPGFAIPASQVRRTVEQIIDTGQATYPIIGVVLDSDYDGEGVRVAQQEADGAPPVTPGGPADVAGIAPGVVIVAMDGDPITQPTEFIIRIRSKAPGEVVVLTVRDDGGQDSDVEVTLGEQTSE